LPRSSTQWDSIAGSRHSLELTIAKRIGALWAKKKKDGEVYLTGAVDLGIIHGEIQIVAWKNKDKPKDKQPDFTVNLSESRQEKPDSVPSIEVDDSLGLDDRKTEDEIPFT
jgi:uncharacterized protein (DUF736 family)